MMFSTYTTTVNNNYCPMKKQLLCKWMSENEQCLEVESIAYDLNLYYYTRRMQMSTSVFKIGRKSPRSFVIPLQS